MYYIRQKLRLAVGWNIKTKNMGITHSWVSITSLITNHTFPGKPTLLDVLITSSLSKKRKKMEAWATSYMYIYIHILYNNL